MKILVINCGSSSIKYVLFEMDAHRILTSGVLDRIGETGGRLRHDWLDDDDVQKEQVYQRDVA